jgi:hypothetical protein
VALAVFVAPWPLFLRALLKSYASCAPGSVPSVSNAIRNGALGLTFAVHGIVSNGLWDWAGGSTFAIIVLLVDAAPAVTCSIVFFLELCALIVLRKPRSDARRSEGVGDRTQGNRAGTGEAKEDTARFGI